MGSNEVGQEMLSFGFDTELLSFFWSASDNSPLGTTLPLEAPKSVSPAALFQLFVAPTRAESSFVTWLQYSVVTSGIVVVVGLGSYCTYHCLQNMRKTLFDRKCLRNPPTVSFPIVEDTLQIEDGIDPSMPGSMQLVPAELRVTTRDKTDFQLRLNSERGSNCVGLKGFRLSSSVQSLGRPLFEEDSESDLEDAELEAKYFGPVSGGPESEAELSDDPDAEELLALEEPPLSPTDSAYTSEYETLPRPAQLRLPEDNDH